MTRPGGCIPRGTGSAAEPIAKGLTAVGLPSTAFRNVDTSWLRAEIDAGRPVIVWATYGMRPAAIEGWYTQDGKIWIEAVHGEHTFTVVGYDVSGVYVNDPVDGREKYYAWDVFASSWALLSNMAISGMALAADDKKAEPAQAAPATATTAPAAQPAPFTIRTPSRWSTGTPITKAAFEQYAQQLRGKAKVDSAEASKSLVDQLVMEELLVQEAGKQKLADDPQIKRQLAMVERNLLASTIVRRMTW